MENAKKGRKFVSIKNSKKYKPEICAKFSFQKSRFSEKRNCRNLPLIDLYCSSKEFLNHLALLPMVKTT